MVNTGPWTRLLIATHHVLELWDAVEDFNTDEGNGGKVWAAMEELAAASAEVDLSIAIEELVRQAQTTLSSLQEDV